MVSKIKQERCDCQNKEKENHEMNVLKKKYYTLKIEHHKLVDEKMKYKIKIEEQNNKIKEKDDKIKELQQQNPEYIELSGDEEDKKIIFKTISTHS